MTTFIERSQPVNSGLRVGIKDVFDVVGSPTTLGSRFVARLGVPCDEDAGCLVGTRKAESLGKATIIGKLNLHELAFGATGINPWFGTPVNPIDARLIPGGSSSGSAVAVADGDADVAYGTDTAGSVRVPAACCGVIGLMATRGRVSSRGIWPLSPTLDTVGVLARSLCDVETSLEMLDPTFRREDGATKFEGVVGLCSRNAHPSIEDALNASVSEAGLTIRGIELHEWDAVATAGRVLVDFEAWQQHQHVVADRLEDLSSDVKHRFVMGRQVTLRELRRAQAIRRRWQNRLARQFRDVELLLMPTLSDFPPPLDRAADIYDMRNTLPVNVAGLPAIALPVPCVPFPTSAQLIGPPGAEHLLLRAAKQLLAPTS